MFQRPKSAGRWLWRLATIALLFDIAFWMNAPHRSILNLWGHLNLGRTAAGPHPVISATVFRTPSGVRVVPNFEISRTPVNPPAVEVATAYAIRRVRNYGLLAPVYTTIEASVWTAIFPGNSLTPVERADVESQYASFLKRMESQHFQDLGTHITGGVNPRTSISTVWLTHDILMGAIIVALAAYATRYCISARTHARTTSRLRRGQCPTCAYDLSSLRATPAATCPECGTPIPPIDAKLPIG